MLKVELIYEKTCPNIQAAREQLLRAFNTTQLTPQWQEWEVNEAVTPGYARDYGSPTILINGCDVSGELPSDTNKCCRIYQNSETHNRGVPSLTQIIEALQQAIKSTSSPLTQVNN